MELTILLAIGGIVIFALGYLTESQGKQTDAEYARANIERRKQEMKLADFEINQAQRKKQNAYDALLVKLETEYGSETGAPYVTTELFPLTHEVKMDNIVIGGKGDAARLVEAAKKAMQARVPVATRVKELTMSIALVDAVERADIYLGSTLITQGTLPKGATNDKLVEALKKVEDDILNNLKHHTKDIVSGETYFHASLACDARLAYARQARVAYAHNADVKNGNTKPGQSKLPDRTEYPFSGTTEVNKVISQIGKEKTMYQMRATELGYEIQPIKFGEEYSRRVQAEKQKHGHVQRVAAMRLGMILTAPLQFVVNSKIEENLYEITTVTGVTCAAVLELEANKLNFYVKSLWPLDKDKYFEAHGFQDELFQDDPEMELQEFVDLNLWKEIK